MNYSDDPTSTGWTTLDQHEPQDYLKSAYLGELGGAATFEAVKSKLPNHTEALDLLARVERETARFLKPELTNALQQSEIEQTIESAVARIDEWPIDSWQGFLRSSLSVIEPALTMMRNAETHAPEHLRAVYQTYTAHEQALLDYVHAELQGQSGEGYLTGYLETL